MSASLNPLDYHPAEIAKTIAAALTATVGLLGLVAATFTTGPLATVGSWATAAALFLVPVVVFIKKTEPWIGMLDGLRAGNVAQNPTEE